MNTKIRTAYLSDAQIAEMASAAVQSYDMTADWNAAAQAARECALDDLGVRPSPTAVLLAVKLAKVRWVAITQSVKAAVEVAQ